MAFLEAKNIQKSFGDLNVLRGIDFSMERGEVVVIIGFLFAALIMWAVEHIAGKGIKPLSLSMVLGLLVCYTFGTIWFIIVYSKSAGPISVGAALGMCVIPFIIPDIIKIVLAVILTLKLRPRLPNLT